MLRAFSLMTLRNGTFGRGVFARQILHGRPNHCEAMDVPSSMIRFCIVAR